MFTALRSPIGPIKQNDPIVADEVIMSTTEQRREPFRVNFPEKAMAAFLPCKFNWLNANPVGTSHRRCAGHKYLIEKRNCREHRPIQGRPLTI